MKVLEADIKRACEEYLDYLENQGKLIWHRLNAGTVILGGDGKQRAFKGCKKGTPDAVVIQHALQYLNHYMRVTYLEFKSPKGKQTPEQVEYQIKARTLGCEYYVIRDADELREII